MNSIKDNFPTEDITFNPKRKQSDILKEIEKERPTDGSENTEFSSSSVPQIPTIERAIKYYEENAKGEFKKLYSATATWLRKIMTSPKNKVEELSVDDIDASQ